METKQVIRNESQSSVSVEKNSRGITYSVKVYADSPEDMKVKLDQYFAIVEKKAQELNI